MTYYADFSLYDFIEYEEPEGLTIGWLEDGFDYNIDEVSEEDLANIIDLGSLRQRRSQGWHSCTLCQEYTEHSVTSARANVDYRLGHAEIRAVSDDGALYVAPNLIIHYIVDHLYGPPVEFIDAVRSEVRRRWPDGKWRSATGGRLSSCSTRPAVRNARGFSATREPRRRRSASRQVPVGRAGPSSP